ARGAYKSLADFASRLNPKAVNKRALETMAAAGAFDAMEANRALVLANVDQLIELGQRMEHEKAEGQADFFSGGGGNAKGGATEAVLQLRPAAAWTPMERLSHEFEAVGYYLSGHPLDTYERVLGKLGVKRFTEFETLTERGATAGQLAGIVISARERKSQKG